MAVGSTSYDAFYRLVGKVPQFGGNREPSLIERLCVDLRTDGRVGECHVATGLDPHFTIDAHTLVGRTRVPVYKADVWVTRLGTEHLDSKDILLRSLSGHIKFKLPERPHHLLAVGNLLTV